MAKILTMDYELIAKALFENYENIYDIDLETSEYSTFHESEAYSKLKLKKSGHHFFGELPETVNATIAPDDREYVLQKLSRDNLIKGLDDNKYYTFMYRIMRDGKEIYHQIRATYQPTENGMHVFMGIHDIDDMVRQDQAHRNELASLYQKESNHMRAVLASAAAYMEVNLTKDIMLEKSDDYVDNDRRFIKKLPSIEEIPDYSTMHTWIYDSLVVEGGEHYKEVFSRENLLNTFSRGELRASVLFSVFTNEGGVQPCREVAFLYQDNETADVWPLSG